MSANRSEPLIRTHEVQRTPARTEAASLFEMGGDPRRRRHHHPQHRVNE
jgi:hypothetical protein